MLINCPECKKEISDTVKNCIKCGCPIKTVSQSKITVQKTSKKLKGQLAIAIILMLFGISFMFIHGITGSIIFVVSAIWYFSVRMKIWWEHE